MPLSDSSLTTPKVVANELLRKPTYALISVHGDPAAEIGKDGAGGQNVYVRSLGLALAEQGCQVDMFTRREHPEQAEIVEHAPGCRTIRLTAGPPEFVHRDHLFPYLPQFVESWLTFQKTSGIQYQLIHTNYWLSGWVGLQLKARLGLPQVHTYHSIGAIKYSVMGTLPRIAETRLKVEGACLEDTDYVIATSSQESLDLREYISTRGRIRIIPCGIDTQHFGQFMRIAARRHLNIPPGVPLILYVGRFDRRKGIETLVHACALLRNQFRLYLVGGNRKGSADGVEQQRIRDLVCQLGLESVTTFTGLVTQADLPAYYAAANVCVVPSYYEPFGLVALEAMAAATPVIASQVGGLQNTIVHKETGLLVPPRDIQALATSIQSVLSRPIQSRAWGIKGQQRVQTYFSHRAVSTQVQHLYQSLVSTSLQSL